MVMKASAGASMATRRRTKWVKDAGVWVGGTTELYAFGWERIL